MEFETVIGLEIHVELGTKTKIFCNCKNEFGAPPNTHVCPVCMGSPGVLPVLNEEALKLGIRAGLALQCEIRQSSKFDRKNYFYPDNPKAYQISQYDEPIGEHGFVEIMISDQKKRIGITRVHLEEDAGKLNHSSFGDSSYVDFNRAGVPLIEIVTEPDIRTPEEARLFLEELKSIMQYCLISDCKMEEGSLRCDANISLRPVGQEKFGTKTEIKNMNSFKNVQRGLEYEQMRQDKLLRDGKLIEQHTLRWDEASGSTVVMRSKEDAHDYRYFPEPDLPRVLLSEKYIEDRLQEIPELPMAKRSRFETEYGIPAYDAGVLTATSSIANYFDEAAKSVKDPKMASNLIMGDILGYLKTSEKEIHELPMQPVQLAELISIMEDGTISSKMAKDVLKGMLESGKTAKAIIAEQGLVQISDEGQLKEIAVRVIAANPKSVEDYKAGKDRAIGALVGQVMKETKGKANPQMVNSIILQLINQI